MAETSVLPRQKRGPAGLDDEQRKTGLLGSEACGRSRPVSSLAVNGGSVGGDDALFPLNTMIFFRVMILILRVTIMSPQNMRKFAKVAILSSKITISFSRDMILIWQIMIRIVRFRIPKLKQKRWDESAVMIENRSA